MLGPRSFRFDKEPEWAKEFKKKLGAAFLFEFCVYIMFWKKQMDCVVPSSGLPHLCHVDMLWIRKVQVLRKYRYLPGTRFYVIFFLCEEPPVMCEGLCCMVGRAWFLLSDT